MSHEEEQEDMEVNIPQPAKPALLTVPMNVQAAVPGSSGDAPRSPTKNYKYYWIEKVDNKYAPPSRTARPISPADQELGIGGPKKRKRIVADQLVK